jgi:hypothetical protein
MQRRSRAIHIFCDFLMDNYGKDERADLTADQKKVLKGLAQRYKSAAIEAARIFRGGMS